MSVVVMLIFNAKYFGKMDEADLKRTNWLINGVIVSALMIY